MVWGSLSDIAFSDAKHLLFGYREQLEKKKIHGSTQKYRTAQKKLLSLESLKKYFFLRKLTKMSNLILCFSEIPELFICVRVREVAFSSEDWKKLSVWSSVLFMVFALKMRKREAYRKQAASNVSVLVNKVSVLEHDPFMQVSHTVSWMFTNKFAQLSA